MDGPVRYPSTGVLATDGPCPGPSTILTVSGTTGLGPGSGPSPRRLSSVLPDATRGSGPHPSDPSVLCR